MTTGVRDMGKYVKKEHRANGIGFLFTDAPMQNWGRYSNRTNAVMLLMESGAFLFYGGEYKSIPKGSILVVPAGSFPTIVFTTPESYKRCIIDFEDLPELAQIIKRVMRIFKIFSHATPGVITMFDELQRVVDSGLEDDKKTLFVRSSLAVLLTLLDIHYTDYSTKTDVRYSRLVAKAMEYIDGNFTSPISVETVAKILYVSPSSLAHRFKEETGIPIYRYITKKRIAMANFLIGEGESQKSAAFQAGFSDYACFYRLNKKYKNDMKK
jgi:AraC-like DNA-binding protein